MGQFDYLVPGSTATAPRPVSSTNQFASLIPKSPVPVAPTQQGTPVGQFFAQIPNAAASSFQQAVGGANEIGAGEGPVQAVESSLKVGAGIAGMAFSPLAPITNLIGKAIDFAGSELSNTPLMQNYAKGATDTDVRVLTALQNLGGIAMGILGAKAGDIKSSDIPPAKLAEVSQHPDVVAAAQKLDEAQQAVPPKAQAPIQQLVETAAKPTTNQFADLIPKQEAPPKAGSVEQLAEQHGGWQPGTKVQFDTALQHRDAATVQKMLPIVPEAYKTEFADKLNELVGKEPPKTSRTTQTLKPIEGTGELKTRGAALSIEASAIEKGLTDNLGSLPEYRAVNFKDMAPKIADAFAKDPEGARAIAMGEKAAPKGTTPEMFAVTLEKEATAKGDVQTLHDLANSKLTAAGTTMGQRIASYAQRDEHSVTDAIREVQAAREADLSKRGATIKQDATARISDSIRKTNTVKSWSDFVASIEC